MYLPAKYHAADVGQRRLQVVLGDALGKRIGAVGGERNRISRVAVDGVERETADVAAALELKGRPVRAVAQLVAAELP